MAQASTNQPGANSGSSFEELVLAKGLCKPEQVAECKRALEQETTSGKARTLGDILVARGHLTPSQVKMVQNEIGAQGVQLGNYELVAKIGEGGMGAVYKARVPTTGLEVAVKIISKKSFQDENFLERFKREVAIGRSLQHPHIVNTIDFGESDRGVPYLVLELVEGGDLKLKLSKIKQMSEKKALQVIRDICRALQYANEKGLVHRDVKPDNIMFDKEGNAKLADFGLVKDVNPDDNPDLTQAGQAVGTPHYLSPEQARGQSDIDVRADIYSLGATLYRMVTGQTPFSGRTGHEVMAKHLTEQFKPPDELNPDLSDGCLSLIERMMAKDRVDRYETPEALLLDVERVMKGQKPVAAALDPAKSSVLMSVQRRERAGFRRISGRRQAVEGAAGRRRATGSRELVKGRRGQRATDHGEPDAERRSPTNAELPVGIPLHTKLIAIGGVVGGFLIAISVLLFGGSTRSPAKKPAGKTKVVKDDPSLEDPSKADKTEGKEETDTPAPVPGRDPKEVFKTACEWEKFHPNEFNALIRRYRDAEQLALQRGYKELAGKATKLMEAVEKRRDAAHSEAWGALESKARAAVQTGNYDEALKLLAATPASGSVASFVKPRATALEKTFRDEVNAKLAAALKKSQALTKSGKYDAAVDALEPLKGITYAPIKRKVSAQKNRIAKTKADEIAKRQQAEKLAAEKKFNEYLERFDAAVLGDPPANERDLSQARSVAEEASRDPTIKGMKAQTEALASMGAAIADIEARKKEAWESLKKETGKAIAIPMKNGQSADGTLSGVSDDALEVEASLGGVKGILTVKRADIVENWIVERLGKAEPKSDAERVVKALAMLTDKQNETGEGKGRLKKADALLTAAKDFPLTPRYASRLRRLRVGAAEAAAEDFWEQKLQRYVENRLTLERDLDAVKKDLASFREELLPSAPLFGSSITKALSTLESAVRSLRPLPIDQAKLKELIKGRVTAFDQKTGKATIVWDFKSADQVKDLGTSRPAARASYIPYIKAKRLIAMTGFGQADASVVLPQFMADGIRVKMKYQRGAQSRWKTKSRFMVGLGAPGETAPFSNFGCAVFLADEGGCTFEGHEKVKNVLPTKGELEIRADGPALTASINGKQIISCKAKSALTGSGFAFGGGTGLHPSLTELEISGTLSRAWIQDTIFRKIMVGQRKGPLNVWTNKSRNGLWATATNWSLKRVPRAGDNVIFGRISVPQGSCTAAAGTVPRSLRSLFVSRSYGYVLKFMPGFGKVVEQELSVTHEVCIDGGTVILSSQVTGTGAEAKGVGATIRAQSFALGQRGVLHANGMGFARSTGPGSSTQGGGSHGGHGRGVTPDVYGDPKAPITLGGGGVQGAGGGAIQIKAAKKVVLNGQLACNGSRSGAGGSVWIQCQAIEGAGIIEALGGLDKNNPGGGGRIAVSCKENEFEGRVSCIGGALGKKSLSVFTPRAQPGTVWFSDWTDLVVGTGSVIGLTSGTHTFNRVHVASGGLLYLHGDPEKGKGVHIKASEFQVDANGGVCGNEGGHPTQKGPGALPNAGGTHGGHGASNTKPPYGETAAPVTLGSGGYSTAGVGWGGGAIRIDVPNSTITVNGGIRCNGQTGGAGGSIWLTCRRFEGSGALRARGAKGNYPGGGGRIAVSAKEMAFTGHFDCAGGVSGSSRGQPGTLSLPGTPDLTVPQGMAVGLECGTHEFGKIVVAKGGLLYLHSDVEKGVGTLLKAAELSVEAGGTVSADGGGYGPAKGPGGGNSGTHGGKGIRSSTKPYGLKGSPATLGSGGTGGWGGGAMRIEVKDGTIRVDGRIQSNGVGPGAGGSILIECLALEGTGWIQARGGDGKHDAGGGGRVAVYSSKNNFKGKVNVDGGTSARRKASAGAGSQLVGSR